MQLHSHMHICLCMHIQAALLAAKSSDRADLEAEIAELRREMALERQIACAERDELEAQLTSDSTGREEHAAKQAALALEAEKEKRVAHLQQQAMRRIANAGLASGFGAWQEQWEEAARQKRMLAAAGARLARPALAAAVALWVGEWRAAEAEKAAAAERASLVHKDGEHAALQVSN